tara:strand:- start:18246 stop:18455 length:210 start_codon:yes stop_codon:yes gene_type:complete
MNKVFGDQIALVLARADDEYRGFEPFPEPPPDADPDWYYDHVDGWPWYRHMAERLLTHPNLRAILENNT